MNITALLPANYPCITSVSPQYQRIIRASHKYHHSTITISCEKWIAQIPAHWLLEHVDFFRNDFSPRLGFRCHRHQHQAALPSSCRSLQSSSVVRSIARPCSTTGTMISHQSLHLMWLPFLLCGKLTSAIVDGFFKELGFRYWQGPCWKQLIIVSCHRVGLERFPSGSLDPVLVLAIIVCGV